MPAMISYPPPPKIDFGLSENKKNAEKELNNLLDSFEGCFSKSDILAKFVSGGWSNSTASHPSKSTYDFKSPSGLRLHFSIITRIDRVSLTVSSQPKKMN